MFVERKCFDLEKIDIGSLVRIVIKEKTLVGLVNDVSLTEIKILSLRYNKVPELRGIQGFKELAYDLTIREHFTVYGITILDIEKYDIKLEII